MRQRICEHGGEVHIRGYSDDTFGIYGAVDFDHDDCASGTTREFRFIFPDESGLIVRGRHGAHGFGWLISVAPLDEDKELPTSIQMNQDGYTMVVALRLEPGTRIELRRYRHRRK